ncbi:hypothetical protein CRUP_013693 [Coryphaenoides rupestris]|nr:hypothetical protein CRUP_013693 [Coryphaenoides rupestris]
MMSRAAGLCVLGLLCLHSWVLLGQDLEDQPEVLVLCDDPAVDAAAKAAGENASGVMYSIQFTSRKSDCPAGGDKPWTDCDLAHDEKVMAIYIYV